PILDVTHEHAGPGYFLQRLRFSHRVEPLFTPLVFDPLVKFADRLAAWLRRLQSGRLTDYLAIPGILLLIIMIIGAI
ncbi:MAG: hypothetical protein ACRETO_02510, partial [Gammaproteobacteria bacterium]